MIKICARNVTGLNPLTDQINLGWDGEATTSTSTQSDTHSDSV